MATYDVIVVGLGGMGSSAAYQLAARGARVLGIDRHPPAHALGSSHGGSRITRQAYFEDPAYVPLLLRAAELWRQAEAESGRSLLHLTGGLMIGRPDSRVISGSLRSAEQWGLAYEMLDADQIRAAFPVLRPADDEVALHEANAGYVVPEATVSTHLELAARAGAELRHGEVVQSWTAGESGVEVVTDRERYSADQLVICPGAWAPQLLADLGVDLDVERQVQYWFDPVGGVEPFRDLPVYIWQLTADNEFYGFPAMGGAADGVKAAVLHGGASCSPETIDRAVSDAEVAQIRSHLTPRIPAFGGPLIRAVTCMYTNTLDHHFVIGRHPRHPRVAVASGFSGHGFKFVPVVGEILADLALDGKTRHDIALFAPTRPR
jgi:sarcosine oxidase